MTCNQGTKNLMNITKERKIKQTLHNIFPIHTKKTFPSSTNIHRVGEIDITGIEVQDENLQKLLL